MLPFKEQERAEDLTTLNQSEPNASPVKIH